MRNFIATAVIAMIFMIIMFSLMPKRIVHNRNQQAMKAEQEAMYGPGGVPPEPKQEGPKVSDSTDSLTLLDIVRNAPPPDKQGSLGNQKACKALNILTNRKDFEAFDIMLESVRNCPESPLCAASMNTLSHHWRDDRAIEPLAAAASKGYKDAVKALGSYYLPQSRDALIPLMRHSDPKIRAEAAKYLRGLYKDPVVMSAAESAMDFGTLEVADAFWQFCLKPRYRSLILAAFERHPFSDSFSALMSKIYIHNNDSNLKVTIEESTITFGSQERADLMTPQNIDFLRKRLERLLDDPEHYNFTP